MHGLQFKLFTNFMYFGLGFYDFHVLYPTYAYSLRMRRCCLIFKQGRPMNTDMVFLKRARGVKFILLKPLHWMKLSYTCWAIWSRHMNCLRILSDSMRCWKCFERKTTAAGSCCSLAILSERRAISNLGRIGLSI